MSALCRRARVELELARDLASLCGSKVRYVQRGYVRALKKKLKELDAILADIERETWSEIDDAPAPRKCAWCRATIPATMRRDAKTCSSRCRKLLHRPPATARGGNRRIESAPPLDRAPLFAALPSPATNEPAARELVRSAEATAVASTLPPLVGRQLESNGTDAREFECASGTAPSTCPPSREQLDLSTAAPVVALREVARACLGGALEGPPGLEPGGHWPPPHNAQGDAPRNE